MKLKLFIAIFIIFSFLASCCSADELNSSNFVKIDENIQNTTTPKPFSEVSPSNEIAEAFSPSPSPSNNKVFIQNEIPSEIVSIIIGNSFKENNNITLDDLRYLKMNYIDFNGDHQIGEMIVNKKIADDILEIFEILYDNGFQIEKIRLVDHYDSDDRASMIDNNTSAFNYRVVAGTNKLSNHAYGLALDINPMQNPYIAGKTISPIGSEEYIEREDVRKGMIIKGDVCYNAFISKGFTWGGEWNNIKDYQHFEIEF